MGENSLRVVHGLSIFETPVEDMTKEQVFTANAVLKSLEKVVKERLKAVEKPARVIIMEEPDHTFELVGIMKAKFHPPKPKPPTLRIDENKVKGLLDELKIPPAECFRTVTKDVLDPVMFQALIGRGMINQEQYQGCFVADEPARKPSGKYVVTPQGELKELLTEMVGTVRSPELKEHAPKPDPTDGLPDAENAFE